MDLLRKEKLLMAWEDQYVLSRDSREVTLPEAQAIVGHVFQLAGLPGKPAVVERRTRDQAGYVHGALAYVSHDHLRMVLQHRCTTAVILHECSHLLTDDPLDALELRKPVEVEVHGSVWLSNYIALLDKLMGPSFNMFYLRGTLPRMFSENLPFYPTVRGSRLAGF